MPGQTTGTIADPSGHVKQTAFLVLLFVSGGVMMVVGRTVNLQYFPHPRLSGLTHRQHDRVIKKRAYRGSIFDRNGRVLVSSINAFSVFVDPAGVRLPNERRLESSEKLSRLKDLSRALADALELDFAELWNKVERLSETRFIWIVRRMPSEQYLRLKEMMDASESSSCFRGAYFKTEPKRHYALGSLAGQVLGAIGNHGEGMSGIESSWEAELGGANGYQNVKSDVRSRKTALPELDDVPPREGRDVHLTLDANVQEFLENELSRIDEEFHPISAFGIVIDPRSGDILALGGAPSFDPAKWEDYRFGERRRLRGARAVSDCYELGSVIKPIVAAAAVNAGILNVDTVIDCGNGTVRAEDGVHSDHHPYGALTVAKVLAKSSNIGAYRIMKSLGRQNLNDYFKAFGFGAQTGVTFPGETPGILRTVDEWKQMRTSSWNLAIGYGTSISPIQLAMAYGAIANGGYLMRPRLVTSVVNAEGHLVQQFPVEAKHRVIRESVSRRMREALQTVVQKDATGRRARVEGYEIAGKTGTAEKLIEVRDDTGRVVKTYYDKTKHIASFVGFAPPKDPTLLVYIGIDQPNGSLQFGGQVAAPAVGAVFRQLFKYYHIEPEELTNEN